MEKIYLVDGKRTPFGKFGGSLKDISPVDLAVEATKGVLKKLELEPAKIDHFILGNVIPTTTDALYGGRHLALKCGATIQTPGYTLNRLCGSGIQSILDGSRLIKLGEAQATICAGAENMSNVPHLTYGGRFGTKYGALHSVDMLLDSLVDKYAECPMGVTAENLAEKFEINRDESDEFAFQSHKKLAQAYQDGHIQNEIIPVSIRKGVCDRDEHLRDNISIEEIQKLRTSFKKDGVVTPASASGIVDGAASSLIASEKFVTENKLSPIAEIIDGIVIGVDPKIMGIGPSPAIKSLLKKNKLSLEDIDLFEINEAFAAQALACSKDLMLDPSKLNIWGGAIAVGHPLAASGTRITTSLANQLRIHKKKYGIAAACIGGGQGIAILLKNTNL